MIVDEAAPETVCFPLINGEAIETARVIDAVQDRGIGALVGAARRERGRRGSVESREDDDLLLLLLLRTLEGWRESKRRETNHSSSSSFFCFPFFFFNLLKGLSQSFNLC